MIADEAQAQAWLAALPEWDARAAERLDQLIDLLRAENAQQNLVSAASLEQVWQRHIADSAQLLSYVPRETREAGAWLDLGTGAGFPGLVIAALRPELPVLMVESRARRSAWLKQACAALDLPNARVIGARLELVDSQPVRVISARAFAPLPRLLELSARFSTPQTIWLLPKGQSARQELAELSGWNHAFHVEQSLTNAEAGLVVGKLTGRKGRKSR
jgi:16S rRNA (guanine527-N7)-methyltransferase